jgi:hypothetical protein
MNTCAQLATVISKRIQILYGKEVCQTSTNIVCQVHSLSSHIFDCLVRHVNYGSWLVTLLVTLFMFIQGTRNWNCGPSDIIMFGDDSNNMITLNQ